MLFKLLGPATLSLIISLSSVASSHAQTTVAISCSSLGIELALCRSGAEAWAKETGNQVKLVSTPADANQRLALYQTLLAAQSADIDVFQIDVIWPGILARHFIDLREAVPPAALEDQLAALIANNTVEGRLVAMPWFVDAGLLYYRKDLLEKHGAAVPRTWEDLENTARAIVEAESASGNNKLQGFVWQGRAYEGLTCNALEWIYAFGGGTIIDAEGRVTIDNPNAVAAIDMAAGWIGKISPQGVLGYAEEESRAVFQAGNAVFMRNWPYAWALANAGDSPVKDKVAVTVLPTGPGSDARHAATLGGQQLAVSRYSEHPEAAADLVRYLTSAEEQKRRAIEGSFNPTRPSLYREEEVLKANPFYASFLEILESAVARPSTVTGRRYNQVSSEFVRAVHRTLSGQENAKASLANLAQTLDRMSRGGRW